jgi:hypothetical protein
MELNVSAMAMKLLTIHMREKEITLSLNKVRINMRIMSMNALLQYMMLSIIMASRLHLEEFISMRAPIKIFLEGDENLGKFINNIEESMILISTLILLWTFCLHLCLLKFPLPVGL